MSIIDLVQWWNLIFALPFVAALIPLLLQATGAAHLGHAGHDVHVGHVGGFHAHHLPHLGHHVEAGTHVVPAAHGVHGSVTPHANAHAHAEHHLGSPSLLSRALGLLGVGKVSIMIVFSSFCFVWGFTGLVSNHFFGDLLSLPTVFIWPSMGVALIASFSLTSTLSTLMDRFAPSVETYGTPQYELTGRTGKALLEISTSSGAAVVLDNQSNRVQVKCRTENGQVIPRGARIALMRYDEPSQMFFVCPAGSEALDSGSIQKLIK